MPEKTLKFWQDPAWWRKNWWTVIVALGVVLGIILTFVGHTSGIAALEVKLEESLTDLNEVITDLEEEHASLKGLISTMKDDGREHYTRIELLSSGVGRIRESIDRIENILMSD